MKWRDLKPYTIEEYGPMSLDGSGRLASIEGYDVYLDGKKVCQLPAASVSRDRPREEIIAEIERRAAESGSI